MIPLRSIIKVFSLFFIMAIILIFTSPTSLAQATPLATSDVKKDIFKLLNEEREAAGLERVEANSKLDSTAQKWAESMAKNAELKHNPKYLEDAGGFEYGWSEVAENISFGAIDGKEAMDGWMDSEGHKANILGNFNRVGLGVAATQDGTLYFVQNFGNAEAGNALSVANLYGVSSPTPTPTSTEEQPVEVNDESNDTTESTQKENVVNDPQQNRAPISDVKPIKNTRTPAPSYKSNIKGEIESITVTNHVMTVKGWAYDTGTSTPLSIFINVTSSNKDFADIKANFKTDTDRKDIYKKFSSELSSSVIGIDWSSPALTAGEYSVQVNAKNMRTNVSSILANQSIVVNEAGAVVQAGDMLQPVDELAVESNSTPFKEFLDKNGLLLLIASGVGFIGSIVALIVLMKKQGIIS